MHNLKYKMLAISMAALTAATPALTTYASYVGNIASTDSSTLITTTTGDESSTTVSESETGTEVSTADVEETNTLSVTVKSTGGEVVINKDEDTEESIEVKEHTDGKTYLDVYDKDDLLISSKDVSTDGYTYEYEAEAASVMTINAVADDGYTVKTYDLADEDGVSEDVKFDTDSIYSEFSYPVFLDEDKLLRVEFEKAEVDEKTKDTSVNNSGTGKDATTEDVIAVPTATPAEDISVAEEDDGSAKPEETKEADITVDGEVKDAEVAKEAEVTTDETTKSEDLSVNDDTEDASTTPENTEAVDESGTNDLSVVTTPTEAPAEDENNENNSLIEDAINIEEDDAEAEETEHFLNSGEYGDSVWGLDEASFSSARLIIVSDDPDAIIDPEHLIGTYNNIYLLQYKTVGQALNAYTYYNGRVDAVEPDIEIEAASDTVDETNSFLETVNSTVADAMDKESNPVSVAAEEREAEPEVQADNVIALIDTGAELSSNVISQVSLIDDVMSGNGHGEDMVTAITSQNEDAKIISVRAMDNSGKGTVSAIVAGMEYAIEQNVDIINLSLYAKSNVLNAVLKEEIQKAVDAGIEVVGAAGNDNADVKDYMPGSVDIAWIIGACDTEGNKIASSNYGDTVDFYLTADSTSEAAAKFSGYISKNGIANIAKGDLIFDASGNSETDESTSEVSNYVDLDKLFVYSMLAYNGDAETGSFVENAVANTDFVDVYNLTDDDIETLKEFEETYYENKELNEAEDIAIMQDEGEQYDGSFDMDHVYLWTVEKSGEAPNGALIEKTDDGSYTAQLLSGEIIKLTSNKINLSVLNKDEAADLNASILTYKWEAQNNGTVKLSFYQTDGGNSTFEAILIPGDEQFKTAIKNVKLNSGHEYSTSSDVKWYGENTLLKFLNIDNKKYLDWLNNHSDKAKTKTDREYYLGTLYGRFPTDGKGSAAYPHGDNYPQGYYNPNNGITYTESLNCTAFVWHVLWKSGQQSGMTKSKAEANLTDNGFGESRWVTHNGWQNTFNKKNIRRAYFQTKEDLIKYGKPKKGDIIWIFGADEDGTGLSQAHDNHVGIYWGDGTTDLFWHSTHDASWNGKYGYDYNWCDGSTHKNGIGHIVEDASGNSITEIASKNHPPVGYMLIKTFDNTTHSIAIKKTDANGNWNDALKGAEFSLYEKGTNKVLATVTLTSSAAKTFDYECQEGKTYVIKETKVPDGYTKAANQTVKITSSSKETVTVTCKNGEKPPKIQIIKKSSASSEIMALSGYSLEGAQFKVYSDSACTKELATLTTGSDGKTGVETLSTYTKPGNYTVYVKETKAPAGHKLNTTTVTKSFSLHADAGKTLTVNFTDEPQFKEVGALVKKVSQKNQDPIEGVVFEVKLYDGNTTAANALKKTWYLASDKNGEVYAKSTYLADKTFSQYKGKSSNFYTDSRQEAVIPIGTTLTIQEVQVPGEYQIDSTVNKWDGTGLTLTKKTITNDVKPCSIKLKKYDSDGKTPLEGVEFELYFKQESQALNSSGVAAKGYTPLLKNKESVKVKTDTNGEITWNNLDQGVYEITETSTVKGHTLLKDKITVTLPITMTEQEVKANNADTSKGKQDVGYTNNWFFYDAVYEVTNTVTFDIPITGASGIWKYGLIGFGLLAVTGTAVTIYKKPKRKHRKDE